MITGILGVMTNNWNRLSGKFLIINFMKESFFKIILSLMLQNPQTNLA